MLAKGSSLSPTLEPNPDFISAATAKAGGREAAIVLYGPGRADKSENAVYVSKEMFVSLSSSFVGEVIELFFYFHLRSRYLGKSLLKEQPCATEQPVRHMIGSEHTLTPACAPTNTRTHDRKQDVVLQAAEALRDAGFTAVSQLDGGYRCASVVSTLLATLLCTQPRLGACLRAVLLKVTTAAMNLLSAMCLYHPAFARRAWDLAYRPDGRRRAKGNFRDTTSGELEWWTASN